MTHQRQCAVRGLGPSAATENGWQWVRTHHMPNPLGCGGQIGPSELPWSYL